jgi:hypothetical protein
MGQRNAVTAQGRFHAARPGELKMGYLMNAALLDKLILAHLCALDIHIVEKTIEQENDCAVITLYVQPKRALPQHQVSQLQSHLTKEIRPCFSDSDYRVTMHLQPAPSFWSTI